MRRRLKKLLIGVAAGALAALCIATPYLTDKQFGQVIATFPFPFMSSGADINPIFGEIRDDASTASTYTFSNMDINDAAPDRVVVVGLTWSSAATILPPTSLTIGGTKAYQAVFTDASATRQMAFYSLLVTSGATATVVASFASNMTLCTCATWSINTPYQQAIDAVSNSSNSAQTITASDLLTTVDGVVIGMGKLASTASPNGTISWSGSEVVIEDFDHDSGALTETAGHFKSTVASGTRDITYTETATAGQIVACAASWSLDANTRYYQVLLNCAFDGADASTTVTDDSQYAGTITCVGNAQLDTGVTKFGTATGLVDGSGDYFSVAGSNLWDFYAGVPFTMEGWFNWAGDAAASVQHLLGRYAGVGSRSYRVARYKSDNTLRFECSTDGSTALTDISASFTPSLGTWYHICLDFDMTTYRLYVDGAVLGTSTTLRNLFRSSGLAFTIGGRASTEYFNGSVDSVRVTRGTARYAGAFTPPSAAFPTS